MRSDLSSGFPNYFEFTMHKFHLWETGQQKPVGKATKKEKMVTTSPTFRKVGDICDKPYCWWEQKYFPF